MLVWNHVWLTICQRPMEFAAAIVGWVRGTGLGAFVERLSSELHGSYLAEYERKA